MLALVGALAFALLSMAALTTDLGLAASEQSRLEVAAEAAALGAVREAARLELDLATGALSRSDLRCAPTPEACIEALAAASGRRAANEVVGEAGPPRAGTEVDLGPGDVQIGLTKCGDTCWEAGVERAVPLLFGQGSLVGFQGSSLRSLLDAREQGSALVGDGRPVAGSLRARGIPIGSVVRAEARPAVRIGLPEVRSRLPGRAPFAMTLQAWRDFLFDEVPRSFRVDGLDLLLGPLVVGRRLGASTGLQAGVPLGSDGTAVPLASPSPYVAYVPLTENGIVVGFGYAAIEAGGGSSLVLRRLASRVAPGNASASPRFLVGASDMASVFRAGAESVVLRAPVPR